MKFDAFKCINPNCKWRGAHPVPPDRIVPTCPECSQGLVLVTDPAERDEIGELLKNKLQVLTGSLLDIGRMG